MHVPPQEFELRACSQGNTVLTTWPTRGFQICEVVLYLVNVVLDVEAGTTGALEN